MKRVEIIKFIFFPFVSQLACNPLYSHMLEQHGGKATLDQVITLLADLYQKVNPTKVPDAGLIVQRFWPSDLEGLLASINERYQKQLIGSREWDALYEGCIGTTITKATEQLVPRESEIRELYLKQQEKDERIAALEETLMKASVEHRKLEETLTGEKKKTTLHAAKRKGLDRECDELKKRLQGLQEEHQKECETLKRIVGKQDVIIKQTQKESEKAQAQTAHLSEMLSQKESSLESTQKLSDKIIQLEAKLSSSEAHNSSLEQMLHLLESQQPSKDVMCGMCEKMAHHFSVLNSKISDLQSQSNTPSDQQTVNCTNCSDMRNEVSVLNSQIAELQKNDIPNQITLSEQSCQSCVHMSTQVTSMQHIAAEITAEIQRLSQENAALKQAPVGNETLSELNKQFNEQSKELAVLKSRDVHNQLQEPAAHKTIEVLNNKLLEQTKEMMLITRENAALLEKDRHTTEQLSSLRNAINRYEGNNSAMRHSEVEKEVEGLHRLLQQKQSEINNLREALSNFSSSDPLQECENYKKLLQQQEYENRNLRDLLKNAADKAELHILSSDSPTADNPSEAQALRESLQQRDEELLSLQNSSEAAVRHLQERLLQLESNSDTTGGDLVSLLNEKLNQQGIELAGLRSAKMENRTLLDTNQEFLIKIADLQKAERVRDTIAGERLGRLGTYNREMQLRHEIQTMQLQEVTAIQLTVSTPAGVEMSQINFSTERSHQSSVLNNTNTTIQQIGYDQSINISDVMQSQSQSVSQSHSTDYVIHAYSHRATPPDPTLSLPTSVQTTALSLPESVMKTTCQSVDLSLSLFDESSLGTLTQSDYVNCVVHIQETYYSSLQEIVCEFYERQSLLWYNCCVSVWGYLSDIRTGGFVMLPPPELFASHTNSLIEKKISDNKPIQPQYDNKDICDTIGSTPEGLLSDVLKITSLIQECVGTDIRNGCDLPTATESLRVLKTFIATVACSVGDLLSEKIPQSVISIQQALKKVETYSIKSSAISNNICQTLGLPHSDVPSSDMKCLINVLENGFNKLRQLVQRINISSTQFDPSILLHDEVTCLEDCTTLTEEIFRMSATFTDYITHKCRQHDVECGGGFSGLIGAVEELFSKRSEQEIIQSIRETLIKSATTLGIDASKTQQPDEIHNIINTITTMALQTNTEEAASLDWLSAGREIAYNFTKCCGKEPLSLTPLNAINMFHVTLNSLSGLITTLEEKLRQSVDCEREAAVRLCESATNCIALEKENTYLRTTVVQRQSHHQQEVPHPSSLPPATLPRHGTIAGGGLTSTEVTRLRT